MFLPQTRWKDKQNVISFKNYNFFLKIHSFKDVCGSKMAILMKISTIVNVNLQFCYYLSLERVWPFTEANLDFIYTRTLCSRFIWKWSSRYWEKNFVSCLCNFTISLSFPFEKGVANHSNKPECNWREYVKFMYKNLSYPTYIQRKKIALG